MDLINRENAMQSRPEYLNEYVVRDDKEKEIYDRAFAKGWNECSDQWLDNIRDLPSVQPEIILCKDCKYQDENWRRVSVKWLPCMDVRTGSNWYCGSAERRTG